MKMQGCVITTYTDNDDNNSRLDWRWRALKKAICSFLEKRIVSLLEKRIVRFKKNGFFAFKKAFWFALRKADLSFFEREAACIEELKLRLESAGHHYVGA